MSCRYTVVWIPVCVGTVSKPTRSYAVGDSRPVIEPKNVETWLFHCDEQLEYCGVVYDAECRSTYDIGVWSKHKPKFVVRQSPRLSHYCLDCHNRHKEDEACIE